MKAPIRSENDLDSTNSAVPSTKPKTAFTSFCAACDSCAAATSSCGGHCVSARTSDVSSAAASTRAFSAAAFSASASSRRARSARTSGAGRRPACGNPLAALRSSCLTLLSDSAFSAGALQLVLRRYLAMSDALPQKMRVVASGMKRHTAARSPVPSGASKPSAPSRYCSPASTATPKGVKMSRNTTFHVQPTKKANELETKNFSTASREARSSSVSADLLPVSSSHRMPSSVSSTPTPMLARIVGAVGSAPIVGKSAVTTDVHAQPATKPNMFCIRSENWMTASRHGLGLYEWSARETASATSSLVLVRR